MPADAVRTGSVRGLNFRRMRPSLSLADTLPLALATGNCWMLLTGDLAHRNLAVSEGVVCDGLLWVFDQMSDTKVEPYVILCAQGDQRSSTVQAASNRGEQTHIPLEGAAY